MTDRRDSRWPALPLDEWQETRDTLHMWTQVIGKIRLARTPLVNHWWNVTLYVTARGLTTGPMAADGRTFQIVLDFLDHRLTVETSAGRTAAVPLAPMSVAAFHAKVMDALDALELSTRIWPVPVEVPDPIPFPEDHTHAAYDPAAAERFWRVLIESDRVLSAFRARFLGKASPSHFFWGSFDLAATRFSGRRAPRHPGAPGVADWVTQEAYSHECWSAGFWPGGPPLPEPIYYAYAYPAPDGFAEAQVRPETAFWSAEMSEFVLPYEAVRRAASPDAALTDFLASTYEAAAVRGGWDRPALERETG